jgi:exosortase/archaeosortase family protein
VRFGALLVFAIPLLEIFWLRHCVHQAFGPNLLSLGIHATDIYVPLLLGAALVFYKLRQSNRLPLVWQARTGWLNALFLLLTTGLVQSFDRIYVSFAHAEILVSGIFLLAGLTFGTSLFLALSPRTLREALRPYSYRIGYGFIAILGLIYYPVVLDRFWPSLSQATSTLCAIVLQLLGIPIVELTQGKVISLWHPRFCAEMVMGCSGLEGVFFFLFSFWLLQVFHTHKTTVERAVGLTLGGCLFLFALNVLRICLFFSAAVFLEKYVASQTSRNFFEWVFHANVGWILYAFGIHLFFQRFCRPTYPL